MMLLNFILLVSILLDNLLWDPLDNGVSYFLIHDLIWMKRMAGMISQWKQLLEFLLRVSFVYSFVFLFFGLSCTCLMAYFGVEEAMCDSGRSRGNRTIQSFV